MRRSGPRRRRWPFTTPVAQGSPSQPIAPGWGASFEMRAGRSRLSHFVRQSSMTPTTPDRTHGRLRWRAWPLDILTRLAASAATRCRTSPPARLLTWRWTGASWTSPATCSPSLMSTRPRETVTPAPPGAPARRRSAVGGTPSSVMRRDPGRRAMIRRTSSPANSNGTAPVAWIDRHRSGHHRGASGRTGQCCVLSRTGRVRPLTRLNERPLACAGGKRGGTAVHGTPVGRPRAARPYCTGDTA